MVAFESDEEGAAFSTSSREALRFVYGAAREMVTGVASLLTTASVTVCAAEEEERVCCSIPTFSSPPLPLLALLGDTRVDVDEPVFEKDVRLFLKMSISLRCGLTDVRKRNGPLKEE